MLLFLVRRAKEFNVLKWFVDIFVLFIIGKCVIQSILVEANLYLAVKLQPDLNIQAIPLSRPNFRNKIKVNIEPKFYCTRHASMSEMLKNRDLGSLSN